MNSMNKMVDQAAQRPKTEDLLPGETDELNPTQKPEPAGSLDLKDLELKSQDPQAEKDRRNARARVLRFKNRLRSRKRAS